MPFSFLRCKLRSRSPGAGGLWLWTSKEKLGAAVTLTAMDLWYHTPVLQTSLLEDLWLFTSPQGWDLCLWMGTGTSPGTWRMAPSQRTLYLRRHRSSTFPKRSSLLIYGRVRKRNPRLWWRRRGRQSCDLQGTVYKDENWNNKWHSLRMVWRGWLCASTLPIFSPVNRARTRLTDEAQGKKGVSLSWAGLPLVEGWWPSSLRQSLSTLSTTTCRSECVKGSKQTAI